MQNKETKEPYPPAKSVAWNIHKAALKPEHSISLMPGNGGIDGINGDHICFAPPYNCTKEEIEMIVGRASRVVGEVLGE